jgi:hypothetical protein
MNAVVVQPFNSFSDSIFVQKCSTALAQQLVKKAEHYEVQLLECSSCTASPPLYCFNFFPDSLDELKLSHSLIKLN